MLHCLYTERQQCSVAIVLLLHMTFKTRPTNFSFLLPPSGHKWSANYYCARSSDIFVLIFRVNCNISINDMQQTRLSFFMNALCLFVYLFIVFQ